MIAEQPSAGTGPDVPAGRWRIVALVANREITTRLRSKMFRIATILLVVMLIGFSVVAKLIGGGGSTLTVGVTPATAPLAGQLVASAATIGEKVTTATVPDEATGRARVRAGKLDALLVGDGSQVSVVVPKDLDVRLRNALHVLAGQLAFSQQITALGGDPARIGAAVASAPVTVESLQPPHAYHTQQLILGILAGILIYLSLILNGQAVAQGVVEEKSNRVVELLLATVRPWQLMAGKVAGIGTVGLLQMAIVGVAGIGAGLATGALTISTSAAAGTVIWLITWYLLGFVGYALVFAAVGALVSRQEDVGGVVAPVLMFMVVGYVLGVSILPADPGNSLVGTLSMIPMFAPTLMPMRLAMGGVPAWQAAVAVAGMLAVIPALVALSGRIYRNAVMRSGVRVKLSEAWRSA